ncbi:unnamed protein product [Linum tenue]|uniref:Uncharacterized protein n=1 Tax=Linum tenue TaxID=586396 RepID=A0AAV0QXB1_9ROSI|nr:unnamed protein product [Linum tenue]
MLQASEESNQSHTLIPCHHPSRHFQCLP